MRADPEDSKSEALQAGGRPLAVPARGWGALGSELNQIGFGPIESRSVSV